MLTRNLRQMIYRSLPQRDRTCAVATDPLASASSSPMKGGTSARHNPERLIVSSSLHKDASFARSGGRQRDQIEQRRVEVWAGPRGAARRHVSFAARLLPFSH